MTYQIQYYEGYRRLPDKYQALLEVAAAEGLYSRREWFELLMRFYYVRGQVMRLYTVEDAQSGQPLLMLPLYVSRTDSAAHGAYTLAAVAHYENYTPICILLDPTAEERQPELLEALFSWIRSDDEPRNGGRADVVRLAPFVSDSVRGNRVLDALRAAGFTVQIYANSYNQYEDVAGMSYADYLAARSSNQRYNSRRRRRNLEKQGEVSFEMVTGASEPEALRDAIDDYILVAVHSWKSRESTISKFIIAWIRTAAELGHLRLGILRLDGKAIAAQFWVFSGGTASLTRTNFREDYRDQVPGVVLTNMIIEYVLDVDTASALDFGYGDEDYKGRWVQGARYYSGLIAFNTDSPRGFYYAHKNIMGQPFKRMIKRGRSALQVRGAV